MDRYIRLVLTETGPMFQNIAGVGDRNLRRVRNLYMTRGFADLVYQEALLCNGKCKLLRSRVSYILTQRGCTLTSLLPTDVRHWWPLIEDVFNSPQIRQLHHDVTSLLCSRDEYKYISIDATIKCCVSLYWDKRPGAATL